MKHYIALILGAFLFLTTLAPSAEARDRRRRNYSRQELRDHQRRSVAHYRRSVRHYNRSQAHYRRKTAPYYGRSHRNRVWRDSHYERSNGRRIFIPGRYVYIY